jgi:sialate O-acetylesterase
MSSKSSLIAIAALVLLQLSAFAKVKLPALLSDHVVLQQQSAVTLWGNTAAGKAVQITTSWDQRTYTTAADNDGAFELKVKTPAAGGPYAISFDDGELFKISDVMIGEVWICSGQSNMSMTMRGFPKQPILNAAQLIAAAGNTQLRLFKLQRAASLSPLKDVKGDWNTASPESAAAFSAMAYQFGELLQRKLKVPVGLILTAVGGTQIQAWMSKAQLQPFRQVKIPLSLDTLAAPHKAATALYNGMVAPLLKFNIKGAIWCQGEANRDDPALYRQLFPAMVAGWRKDWNLPGFPFYYVQIAPLNSRDKRPTIVLVREAQQKSQDKIPNSAMVSTLDVGMEKFIHYMDKTTPAMRLANCALARTYQFKGIPCEGPVYQSMKIKGNQLLLSFQHASQGLKQVNDTLKSFEVAGEDQVFYPADAHITSANTITVRAAGVQKPVALRYAFHNWAIANIFNSDGLPLPSFRTDNWLK